MTDTLFFAHLFLILFTVGGLKDDKKIDNLISMGPKFIQNWM